MAAGSWERAEVHVVSAKSDVNENALDEKVFVFS